MKLSCEDKIQNLLEQLTLDEKISMIHGDALFRTKGVERLGIPPLKMTDGPMGVRQEFPDASWVPVGNSDDYVTYLPCNSALAATWNRSLAEKTGEVLGAETRGRGKDVILAPGINIKRTPLCGRNFEYMSEDPYLAGEMAVPLIRGIQKKDVAACVKHFALNNQEIERLWVEVEADDRALREIYLPAFEKAVKVAKSHSIMGAYNRFRGEHCCESKYLLTDILRKEWGYDGTVISDWGGVHRTKEAAESSLDIEMSVTDNFDDYCMADPLKAAIESGEIPESLVDEKVRNILRLMERLHMLGDAPRQSGSYNRPEHQQAALEAARESIVLLKNENRILPLDEQEQKPILVIGDNASRLHANGGGSAEIKALYEISPLMGIKKLLGGSTNVVYVQGYLADDCDGTGGDVNWQAESLYDADMTDEESCKADLKTEESSEQTGEQAAERVVDGTTEESTEAAMKRIAKRTTERNMHRKELREQAAALAAQFEKVIFVGGLNHQYDLEGQDRTDMKLPYEQDELIEAVLEANPNTIIVMMAGSPVEMPWLEKAKSLVWCWYGGMEGGTALAEVLFGRVNPSGKMPDTLPVCHTDCSAHCVGEHPGDKTVAYREGIFVGYRYYDKNNVKVNFPFGYGLSYTEFLYESLDVSSDADGKIQVKVSIKNIGNRTGKEVIQVYVRKPESSIERPDKELRAFQKVELQPGESRKVILELAAEAFSYYNVEMQAFVVEPGIYEILAGPLKKEIMM